MAETKITFCGDTHGAFKSLEYVYEQEKPDYIIQCGDFGIWTTNNHKVKTQYNTRHNIQAPIMFCRGNHENHDLLDRTFGDKGIHELKGDYFNRANGIYLCNHGSILELTNRHDLVKKIMFIGGASSIDKQFRQEGKSWWKQELLSKAQEDYVLSRVETEKPDIIVSHTAPESVIAKMGLDSMKLELKDPVSKFLDAVYELHKPNLWVHGHFHKHYIHREDITTFVGLDMCNERTGRFDKDKFCYSLVI